VETALSALFAAWSPTPQPAAACAEDSLAPDAWQAMVAAVRDEHLGRDAEKVVLARGRRLRAEAPFSVETALQDLRAAYPSCFVFAVARGDRCFLGATPERLVRLRDGVVTTMCLAGSIGRGATEQEDRWLGETLLASAKDRAEHEFVVRDLRASLATVCESVVPVGAPVLLKVKNVQHLLTTVVGRVADERTILDLVAALHPTPAVGGSPRVTALSIIRQCEGLDRGWYAGPIGWLDAKGEGEFAVALRSGVVHGQDATLFAGCGIVRDSDPAAEFAESQLKLQPMLKALTGGAP
jgi:isochorismate synthase